MIEVIFLLFCKTNANFFKTILVRCISLWPRPLYFLRYKSFLLANFDASLTFFWNIKIIIMARPRNIIWFSILFIFVNWRWDSNRRRAWPIYFIVWWIWTWARILISLSLMTCLLTKYSIFRLSLHNNLIKYINFLSLILPRSRHRHTILFIFTTCSNSKQ